MAFIPLFRQLHHVLNKYDIPDMCFKPQQLMCWERLLLSSDQDVVCVLPTGYGKSLIYQLLGDLMPQRVPGSENIVVVVCPLNAIIED